jgi:hypothetical protein
VSIINIVHVLKIFIENYTADQILENADLLGMVYATFGDFRLGHCIHWRAWECANISRFDKLAYKTFRNPTIKILFVNLTISDLGVLLIRHSFHSIQLYKTGRWIFGELACKIVPPVSCTFLTVSILSLVAISYQRYKCIVDVFNSELSRKKTIVSISLFWATALTVDMLV